MTETEVGRAGRRGGRRTVNSSPMCQPLWNVQLSTEGRLCNVSGRDKEVVDGYEEGEPLNFPFPTVKDKVL